MNVGPQRVWLEKEGEVVRRALRDVEEEEEVERGW
jgi:hypothetical protein